MKSKALHFLDKYHRSEINALKKSLRKAGENYNTKTIHKLRVSIKKLHAFYKLIEMLYPKEFNAHKHLHILHKGFQDAGMLRESQINKELIKTYPIPPSFFKEYRRYLTVIEKRAYKNLKKSLSGLKAPKLDSYSNLISKLCKPLQDKHFTKECKRFVKKQSGKIRDLLTSPLTEKTLHHIRKHLKQLVYVIRIQQNSAPESYSEPFIKELKQTEMILGLWHDQVILMNSLIAYKKSHPDMNEKILNSLLLKIGKQNKRQVELLKPKISFIVNTCLNH